MIDLAKEYGLVSEAAYAKLRGISIAAVRNERSRGEGPPFVRLGRTVHYIAKGIGDQIAENTVTPGRGKAPTLATGTRRRRQAG